MEYFFVLIVTLAELGSEPLFDISNILYIDDTPFVSSSATLMLRPTSLSFT